MDTVLMSGCAYCITVYGYSAERVLGRVCLPFGKRGYSAERERLGGCAYHLVGVDKVLSGCTCAGVGVLAFWQACLQ